MRRATAAAAAMITATLTVGAIRPPGSGWVQVARWDMNERSGTTMIDSVAGRHGTTANVRTGQPGYSGLGYAFDGESSSASVPSVDALNPGSRDIRLTIYLKTVHKPDSVDWDLFRKGYAQRSPGRYKMEYQPTGQAGCDFADRAEVHGAGRVMGGPDLADGRWHQVSCTKTAASIELTVDARTVATKEVRLGTIANTDPVVLGAYRGPAQGGSPPHAGFFLGTLDGAVLEMR
jgi:hypothetical protein